MKQKVHAKWYNNCKVACACGNTFTTGSSLPEINVEICSACHPFFTGEMKYVDTLGRVEKFKQQQARVAGKKYVKKSERRRQKNKTEETRAASQPKSLKEMLQKEMKKL